MRIKEIENLYKRIPVSKEILSYLFFGNLTDDYISANKDDLYFNHSLFHYKKDILQIERFDFTDTESKVELFLNEFTVSNRYKDILKEIFTKAQELQNYIDDNRYTNKTKLLEDKIKLSALKSVMNDLVELTEKEINIKL